MSPKKEKKNSKSEITRVFNTNSSKPPKGRFYYKLTLYTLTSICKFSLLFHKHSLSSSYIQGQFVQQPSASYVCDHFVTGWCHWEKLDAYCSLVFKGKFTTNVGLKVWNKKTKKKQKKNKKQNFLIGLHQVGHLKYIKILTIFVTGWCHWEKLDAYCSLVFKGKFTTNVGLKVWNKKTKKKQKKNKKQNFLIGLHQVGHLKYIKILTIFVTGWCHWEKLDAYALWCLRVNSPQMWGLKYETEKPKKNRISSLGYIKLVIWNTQKFSSSLIIHSCSSWLIM